MLALVVAVWYNIFEVSMKQSKQRNLIYEVVHSSHDHPDAKTVLARVNQVMDSVNLATVYRNLTQLCEQGMIKRIPLDSGDRFDFNTTNHSHFYCKKCKCVFDVVVEGMDTFQDQIAEKYSCIIESIDNVIQGYCADCDRIMKAELNG